MIPRNIGRTERIVRLLLGIALVCWVLFGEHFGVLQGVALLAAFALFWNSIFSRCYLWKWLGLNSCNPEHEDCMDSSSGGTRA